MTEQRACPTCGKERPETGGVYCSSICEIVARPAAEKLTIQAAYKLGRAHERAAQLRAAALNEPGQPRE